MKRNPPKSTPIPYTTLFRSLLSGTQLNATADVGGSFVYTPAAGTKLNAGSSQALKVDFTPKDTHLNSTSKNISITVLSGNHFITWSKHADITYTALLRGTQH